MGNQVLYGKFILPAHVVEVPSVLNVAVDRNGNAWFETLCFKYVACNVVFFYSTLLCDFYKIGFCNKNKLTDVKTTFKDDQFKRKFTTTCSIIFFSNLI